MKKTVFTIFLLLSLMRLSAQSGQANTPVSLLDNKLTQWYKWLGVPHFSVTGLPAGTPKGDGMNGTPLGLQDPKNVFSVITSDDEKILKVTGEIYGSLITKKEYGNYHLHLKYKWGNKKWQPRLVKPRDMGIIFHVTGRNEDAFWSAFMTGVEFQITEGNSGDLFLIPNKDFTIKPFAEVRFKDRRTWSASAPWRQIGGGISPSSIIRSENYESRNSEWTTVDLYAVGRTAVYLINGHVVMALRNIGKLNADKTRTPLVRGKILLQSEGAEGYYKDITLQQITDIPMDIKKAAGLYTSEAEWKLGVELFSFNQFSFPEQLAKADSAGVHYIEAFSFGKAGTLLKDSVIYDLSTHSLEQLKNMADAHGLKMSSLYINGSKSLDRWVREFRVAKALGVEYVTGEPRPWLLAAIDSLSRIYGIRLALHNHRKGPYTHPDSMLKAIKVYPRLMACPDIGSWTKAGIDPVEGLKKLDGHIHAIHFKDADLFNSTEAKDVIPGEGVTDFHAVFDELSRQKFKGYIVIEYDRDERPSNLPSVIKAVDFCKKMFVN